MADTVKLYSVFHKDFFKPAADYVVPIHAGKSASDKQLDILSDNTGDHISHLNNTFCELTVLYWLWKNAERSTSHFGLCHYRRYFTLKPPMNALKPARIISYFPAQENIDKVVTPSLHDELTNLLATNDVIVQQPMLIHRNKSGTLNLEQHYKKDHIANDWNVLITTIAELYPAYKPSIKTFNESLKMSFFNMMIAPWNVWDDYLTWLFTILFEVQKRILVSDNAYQARVFGFMSERLMNLYLQHNDTKTAYLPIAVFDKEK